MELASKDLIHEHEAILFALKVLEEICNRIESGKEVPVQDITDLIDFIKLFADKCHHGKEENFLFPAMEEAGIQKQNGPIGVMLMEHTSGREFIKNMQTAVSGSAMNKPEFVKSARGYISLLRSHIEKENNVLFPIGDVKISPSKQKELLEQFEKFEDEVIGKGKHEELHKQLHEFNLKYLKTDH
ncbi:MAG TPA: hemerythrin domain-containing protein [Spirochaetota bacterium]|nr:hemerythrin domain-containing protein [Spirochaetota bacterium]